MLSGRAWCLGPVAESGVGRPRRAGRGAERFESAAGSGPVPQGGLDLHMHGLNFERSKSQQLAGWPGTWCSGRPDRVVARPWWSEHRYTVHGGGGRVLKVPCWNTVGRPWDLCSGRRPGALKLGPAGLVLWPRGRSVEPEWSRSAAAGRPERP